MVQEVQYGSGLAAKAINQCGKYLVATNPIPWDDWSNILENKPANGPSIIKATRRNVVNHPFFSNALKI